MLNRIWCAFSFLNIVAVIFCSYAFAQSVDDTAELNASVAKLLRQGKHAQAAPLARRALAATERDYGRDDPATAVALAQLIDILEQTNRASEAIALRRRQVALLGKLFGNSHEVFAVANHNLASLLLRLGKHQDAEPIARRAAEIFRKTTGPKSDALANASNTHAIILERLGRFEQAEPIAKRAVAVWEKVHGRESNAVANGLRTLSTILERLDRYDEAERVVRRFIAITEKRGGADSEAAANDLGFLISILNRQGRAEEAEPIARRAVEIIQKIKGPADSETANALNTLCAILIARSKHVEAAPLARRVVSIWEKQYGPASGQVANARNTLAAALDGSGERTEAIQQARLALDIWAKVEGQHSLAVAVASNNLAYKLLALNDPVAAEAAFNRTVSILETTGRDGMLLATALSGVAEAQFVRSEWTAANATFERYFGKLISRAARDSASVGKSLVGERSNEFARAAPNVIRSVKAAFRLADRAPSESPRAANAAFTNTQWFLSSSSAASVAQMASRTSSGDPQLFALVRERQDLELEWQALDKARMALMATPASEVDAELSKANSSQSAHIDQRIAVIDGLLAKQFPAYDALTSPKPVSISDAQTSLGIDEALVFFFDTSAAAPTPEETFIWVATKTDARWVRSELGSNALRREVAALRCGLDYLGSWAVENSKCPELTGVNYTETDRQMGKPLPFDAARSYALYKSLFGEVEELTKDKQLLIVPSGALSQLPFHVLVTAPPTSTNAGDVKWLVQSNAVTVLPAASSLLALRRDAKSSRAAKPFLGIGNPLLDGDGSDLAQRDAKAAELNATCAKLAETQMADGGAAGVGPVALRGGIAEVSILREAWPLPETANELCDVAKAIGATEDDVFLGGRATETEIKKQNDSGALRDYRMIHFATHGALAGEISGSAEPGLVMTPPIGDGSEADDGYLTATEITALKLDADWVLLSACNTASGGAGNAQALSGLARAFFYAGARSLLVSHWYVSSKATVELVRGAISILASNEKLGRAEALRRSMLALIKNGAPPAKWAPFVVVGEGRSLAR